MQNLGCGSTPSPVVVNGKTVEPVQDFHIPRQHPNERIIAGVQFEIKLFDFFLPVLTAH